MQVDIPRELRSPHPGEMFSEEFLLRRELTPYAVAQTCGVPRTRIERLAREVTPVTGTTPSYWMNLR